ncbi:GM25933 [Drosophila sechellia]|uniref:GM25933 n=1 Tax=Drosophila sechellia TaxID=7238 RepID=B4HFS5_DROSE|nr:GM25933 [Drosophila sechellia]
MHSTPSHFSPMTWPFDGAPDLVNSYDFPMCHGMLNRSKAWHVNAPRRIPQDKPTPKYPEKPGLTATRCENSQHLSNPSAEDEDVVEDEDEDEGIRMEWLTG